MFESRTARLVAIAIAASFVTTAALATDPRFALEEASGDTTVFDDQTNLEWQREPDSSGGHSWVEALDHCESLVHGGHDDWRLPNPMELSTLVDEIATSGPAINPTYFVASSFNTIPFWTSTTNPKNPGNAYIVRFNEFSSVYDNGGVLTQDKGTNALALCVRYAP
jgi:hypothetical protein